MKTYMKNFIMVALFLLLGGYVLAVVFFPVQTEDIVGFRFYTILTNSMEPRIPTSSLVCVKHIEDPSLLEREQIITFRIERLKEEEVLTHHFAYTETIDGITYFRTHPENTTALDPYDVTKEDLIGTYVFHIPYIGNFMLYAASPFGIFTISISAFILILYSYLNEHFDLEEEISVGNLRLHRKHHPKQYVSFEDIQVTMDEDFVYVQGVVCNETKIALGYVKVRFVFYNEDGESLTSYVFYLNGKEKLNPQCSLDFHFMMEQVSGLHDYQISILSAKR